MIDTYVDGLPIPSSSNLFIKEVEEYLFGGFVYFSSINKLVKTTSDVLVKFGSSCDFSLKSLIKSLYPPKVQVVPERPNVISPIVSE